jgi:hypothetical protein
MKKLLKRIFATGLLTCICGFWSGYGSSCFLLVFVMLVGLAILTLFITTISAIPRLWATYGARALVPLLFTLILPALWVAAAILGIRCRIFYFRHHLTEYQEVVQEMEAGQIAVDNKFSVVHIPPEYHHLARFVRADRDSNGIITADFIWAVFWPPHHFAFLYRGDGDPKRWKHHNLWHSYSPIEKNWYMVSD